MRNSRHAARYNQRIRYMQSRSASGSRLGWLTSLWLVIVLLSSFGSASTLTDTARQLAHKISTITGPGAVALNVTNRSSLDEKSVREIRTALEGQLRGDGVRTAQPDQSIGSVNVILSESLREYVWSAEITIGSDEKRIALVSLAKPQSGGASVAIMPVVLRKGFLYAQQRPILDAVVIDLTGGSRLFVLDDTAVTMYRLQSGHWEPETQLPITHTRTFPRDLRGRLLLRRDHLFDVYLPGTYCRSGASVPLTLACNASDDPWPLTPDEGSVRAFYAPARNFFTGALSPGMGKISNVPSFYAAAAMQRANYTLWVLTAVDGSIHMVDGMTDQAIRGPRWGSDLAAVRSTCGSGAQILVSESGDPERDSLRAFEIPDRDPVAASSALEFDGSMVALWPEASGSGAIAIVRREDSGWYEAYRISISCGM